MIALLAPCLLHAEDEWQFWADGNITAGLSRNLKAKVGIQSRLDDSGSLIQEHSDLGIAYTGLADWLDLGLNYRVVFRELDEEVWKYESRPHLNATARFRLFGLAFSNRLRLEYNSPEDFSDFGTVRNKLSLNPPVYLDPVRERLRMRHYKVKPFASYEFFYNTSTETVSRHRFRGGVSWTLTERVLCDFYYLRQEDRASLTQGDINVAGLNLKLLF